MTFKSFTLLSLLFLAAFAAFDPVELQADDIELIAATTVEQSALTFADGPATRFGNTVNGRTHQQSPLKTYRGWQYVTFFDSERRVCIGRRRLQDRTWDVIHFSDHKFKTNDSHNTAVIGICDKDGTIHMAFDHHASQLNYRFSKPGAAHRPETVEWNADVFSKVVHRLGSVKAHEKVTYPRFFPTASGDLMLYYRSVTSGNGDGMIEKYDGYKHDYIRGLGKFISRDIGTYRANGKTSLFRCPYMNSLSYAGKRLHASWIWRDRFEKTSSTNQHDLCYVYSDDDGRSWRNSDGKVIGQTGKEFIHLNSPGLVVAPIAIGVRLSNQNTHYAYPDGRVHIMVLQQVKTVNDRRFVHYWRTSEGKWNHEVLPFSGGRPKLVGAEDGSLILVSESGNRLLIAVGEPNARKTNWNWTNVKLPQPHPVYGEAVLDLQRWEQDCVLSIYSQLPPPREIKTTRSNPVDGIPSPLNVVDYRFKNFRPVSDRKTEQSIRRWTDVTGEFSVDAVLFGVKEGNVAIRKKDGSFSVVPMHNFSNADQEYIRNAIANNRKLLRD